MALDIELSEYGQKSAKPSKLNLMMTKFAADFRSDIDINVGVGYVNEETIPKKLIAEHALEHLVTEPLALNYGAAIGQKGLRDAIRAFLIDNNISGLTEGILRDKEIIIGPNGATSLLDGIAQVLPTGTVITSDPMYYIYCDYLERRGFDVLTIPEDSDGIRTDLLEDKITQGKPDIKFIYVVTVNNPTCTILSNERRQEIVEIATRLSKEVGRKIPVIFDRAYEELIHGDSVKPLKSGFYYDELGLVYEIGTVSKLIAPGLRVGYMIGKDNNFLQAMIQRTCDAGFSAAMPTQTIARAMLEQNAVEQMESVNQGYREKAKGLKACIDEELGEYLTGYSGGDAGFYLYLTFKDIDTSEGSHFFKYLTRTTGVADIDGPPGNKKPRVLYIPGEQCVHSNGTMVEIGKRQLRISYGFEELDRIKAAIGLMKEAAQYAKSKS